MVNKYNKKNIWIAYGILLGVVCFIAVYGMEVLDFCNDTWIMRSADADIKQHYLGWCHFRNAKWTFPLGMMDSLSYPTAMSIIYTDSIPLFAIFFKLLSPILPKTFQYLGLFGIISFALTGAVSALTIKKATRNSICALLGPVIFILSPVMLKRMFYHTSLSAQWIIILAIYYLLDGIANKSRYAQNKIYRRMGILCVLVHIYYLPMVGSLIFAAALEKTIREKKILKSLGMFFSNAFSFCIAAILTMFITGAFMIPGGAIKYTVGDFGANLNTFINPIGMSRIIPSMKLYNTFQYEGGAYLGAGVLALLIVLFLIGLVKIIKNDKKNLKKIQLDSMGITVIIVCVILLILSISPVFAWGDKLLISVPYPYKLSTILGIFRSNGRFVWPVMYFIYIYALKAVALINKKVVVLLLMVMCVAIQLFDLSKTLKDKHNTYTTYDKEYVNIWDKTVGNNLDKYNRIVMLEGGLGNEINAAYFAYEKDMTLNRFYFARDIDTAVNEELDNYKRNLSNGIISNDVIYVMDKRDYLEYKHSCNLHYYQLKDLIFGVSDIIEGIEELK